MDQLDQKRFEKIVDIVHTTLNGLSAIFEEFGIEGMHELTNPSLDQLKDLISKMEADAKNLEKSLVASEMSEGDENTVIALMLLQNIKQGLLYASSLLIGVERFDLDHCQRAHEEIKGNSITAPNWRNN